MITEFAPAKVNLTLHVTGQRDDGYHLLDSLVMFADVGDELRLREADATALSIDGSEAADVPADASNSILKAAATFPDRALQMAFHLTKALPTASGIGGGTADAAAALRGISRLTGAMDDFDPAKLSDETVADMIARTAPLGADVPVCLFSHTAHMSGIGDALTFYPNLPALHAVLINPRVAVRTPDIFAALATKANNPMPPIPAQFGTDKALINWLVDQRNDLQGPASSLFPKIGNALRAIEGTEGCLLARMSGSGATCFGLYGDNQSADRAVQRLSQLHPDWWVKKTVLGQ